MKKTLTILLFLSATSVAYSQSEQDKQKAYELAHEAIQLMDNGEVDKSIGLLETAAKLDPKNHVYPYELGYAYYLKKDYNTSIKYYKKVVRMANSDAQSYQMLGNALDMNNQRSKAIKAYEAGLKKYPTSGRLYLELGNVHQHDWNSALSYYEKGIEVDPKYSSNYYWASKIFCNSTEEVWGMIYGEIFMNLERGSKRTEEISKLLFDTYFNEIQFTSDTSLTVSFCQSVMTFVNNQMKIPFCMVFEPSLLVAIATDTITIKSLNQIRENFISFYYERKFNESHPNVLFDWHKKLIEMDLFECYNYWLLMKGSPEEFDAWYEKNRDRFDRFIEWFTHNPMPISNEYRFHRGLY